MRHRLTAPTFAPLTIGPINALRALRFGKVRKLHSSVLRESKTACDQRPSWIPVAPATPRCFYKVRRLASGKTIQNQPLTSSVLNPRSRELWRQTAPEREFRASAGVPQCRALRAKARVYWGFLRARKSAENILCGATGGPSGIRTDGTVGGCDQRARCCSCWASSFFLCSPREARSISHLNAVGGESALSGHPRPFQERLLATEACHLLEAPDPISP